MCSGGIRIGPSASYYDRHYTVYSIVLSHDQTEKLENINIRSNHYCRSVYDKKKTKKVRNYSFSFYSLCIISVCYRLLLTILPK